MSARVFGAGRWLLAAALAGLVVALAAAVLGPAPAPTPLRRPPARQAEAPRLPDGASAARSADPAGIRDVFRFADDRGSAAHGQPAAARVATELAVPAPPGPRLVGLVRRAGRLMAALSVDGEVELAAPGHSIAGVTVISVGEEGVRVRRADGSELTLALP
jgi:hypothetical protein